MSLVHFVYDDDIVLFECRVGLDLTQKNSLGQEQDLSVFCSCLLESNLVVVSYLVSFLSQQKKTRKEFSGFSLDRPRRFCIHSASQSRHVWPATCKLFFSAVCMLFSRTRAPKDTSVFEYFYLYLIFFKIILFAKKQGKKRVLYFTAACVSGYNCDLVTLYRLKYCLSVFEDGQVRLIFA